MPPSRRPTFLNPLQLQMPVGAWTSIAHRVSGLLLAAGAPVGIYLLGLSLQHELGFQQVRAMLQSWTGKALAAPLLWALAHHLLAGVRHLLSDASIGAPLRSARRSAWLVNAGGFVIAAAAVVLLP